MTRVMTREKRGPLAKVSGLEAVPHCIYIPMTWP
jgi:hypothetical protein